MRKEQGRLGGCWQNSQKKKVFETYTLEEKRMHSCLEMDFNQMVANLEQDSQSVSLHHEENAVLQS